LHNAYNEDVVLYLISQGVEINAKDKDGRTPLHEAAKRYGNATKLKCLIAKGADVNVKDNAGKTPLHDAVADIYWMRLEMVQDLISHGADVHAKDVKGNTPLHIAAASTGNYYVGKRNISKQVDILKFLIASGADVNAKNHQGETPLDVAQIDESKHVLQEAGAVLGTTSLLSVAGLTVNEGIEKQSPTKHQSHNRESADNQTPKPKNERNDRNKFTDYIWVDSIIPIIKVTDRDGVIREMVQSLVDAGGVKKEDYESVVKALIKREELGSTGIGRGIAMPHTKHRSVKRNVGTVAISAEGTDLDCLDEEKAHLFFLVLSPPDFPGDHLRVMEHLTRHLKDDTFRCSLMQAKTREEIIALLEEDDNCERR
jgi:PTS system fructose-specific IIA component/PTS system nitrogen regulatory IIA component